MSALYSQLEVEGLILDPGALRQVHRERITTLSNNVLYRKRADDNTVTESCYICLDGWDIGDEVVRLRCECLHWTHEACLAKSVSQTGRCPTCQTSIHRLDDEIGLAKAAAEGDIVAVRLFLEKGTQHSPRDAFGSTPLLQAACQGQQETVHLLLERGASASEQDMHERMALYWATVGGHEKAAEELFLQVADISFTDEKGKTLLHWAVESGSTEKG